MKTPQYATAIELATENKSRISLMFPGLILEPYDNFFTTDQQFLFREAITHIQSLIVRQLNKEVIVRENTNLSRNNSFAHIQVTTEGVMSVSFKFPYPTRRRYGSVKMFNYFLFNVDTAVAMESESDIKYRDTLHLSRYGDFATQVTSNNSGFIQKLNSVISFFSHLSKNRGSVVNVEGDVFVFNSKDGSFRYSPEDLFSPPQLQEGKVKFHFIPNTLWEMAHTSIANVFYASVSIFLSLFLIATPVVDSLSNFILTVIFLFLTFKIFVAPIISLITPEHRRDMEWDIRHLNSTEPETALSEETYEYAADQALLKVGFIEHLVEVREELWHRKPLRIFTQLAKSLIREAEYKKELFEQLRPLFHLYLPALQESLTQLSVTGDPLKREKLLAEIDGTIEDLNKWLSGIQEDNKISTIKDLQKIRKHIENTDNPSPPKLLRS